VDKRNSSSQLGRGKGGNSPKESRSGVGGKDGLWWAGGKNKGVESLQQKKPTPGLLGEQARKKWVHGNHIIEGGTRWTKGKMRTLAEIGTSVIIVVSGGGKREKKQVTWGVMKNSKKPIQKKKLVHMEKRTHPFRAERWSDHLKRSGERDEKGVTKYGES